VSPGTPPAFHIEKWLTISKLAQKSPQQRAKLKHALATQAQELGLWESLRDIERHFARLEQNKESYRRLFMGTPYLAYKSEILGEAMKLGMGDLNGPFDWVLGPKRSKPERALSIARENLSADDSFRKPGDVVHRTLKALASDFYKPLSAGAFYSIVFSNRHYHPSSAPLSVRQAIFKARRWLEIHAPQIKILRLTDGFRLASNKGAVVTISSRLDQGSHPMIETLKVRLGTKGFKALDAAQVLGADVRTASRWLRTAIETGELERSGMARATRYRFRA
jgi:hypothetical protein